MTINLITQSNLLPNTSPRLPPLYLHFANRSLRNPCLNAPVKALIQDSRNPYPSSDKIQTRSGQTANPPSYSNFLPSRLDPNNAGHRFREKTVFLELIGVDIRRALRENPNIRSTSLETVQKVVHYLQEMGMLNKDFARMVGMCPQVLSMDVSKDLAPVFNFLIDELEIPRKDIRKCVNRCPRLLVSGVKDQIRPALYFLKKLGIPDERFRDCSNTVLLVSSVENTFIPKLEYLQSLGISYEDAVHMVVRVPRIFTFSIENNLRPKFEYLVNEMEGSRDDLLKFPQYFSFSLEKRIKPRHRLLLECNVSLTLPAMLKKTELDFMYTLKQMLAS